MSRSTALGPVLSLVACLGACSQTLELPANPGRSPPRIESFSPPRAFAGELIELRGSGFDAAGPVQVTFGHSAPVVAAPTSGTTATVPVPDDASDGPIGVATAGGQAVSSTAFAFAGLGRIRLGIATHEVDLRPRITAAVPLGDEHVLLLARNLGRLAIGSRRNGLTVAPKPALPLSGVVAVRRSDDGHAVLALTSTCASVSGCQDDATLVILPTEAVTQVPFDESALVRIRLPGLHVGRSTRIAGLVSYDAPGWTCDATAAHCVVAWDGRVWVVTFGGTPPRISTFEQAEQTAYATPLWLGDEHFAVVDRASLTLFDAGSPSAHRSVPLPGLDPAGRLLNAAAWQNTLAVMMQSGRIYRYQVADGEPRLVATSDLLPEGTGASLEKAVSAMAFSSDGRRLAVAQQSRGRVLVLDASGSDLSPISSVAVDEPGGLDLVSSSFLVSANGSVEVLDQESGGDVGPLPVSGLLVAAGERQVSCGSGDANRSQNALEFIAANFGAVVRLDAGTLAPLPDDCGEVRLPYGFVWTAASLRTRGELLVALDSGELFRIPRTADTPPLAVRLPTTTSLAKIQVSGDDAYVALIPSPPVPPGSGTLAAPSEANDLSSAASLSAGAVAFDDAGHLAVVADHGLAVYDLAHPAAPPRTIALSGAYRLGPTDTSPRPDVLLVSEADERQGLRVDLTTGTIRPLSFSFPQLGPSMLSPSRLQLWTFGALPGAHVAIYPADSDLTHVGPERSYLERPYTGDAVPLHDGRVVLYEFLGNDRIALIE